MRVNGGSNYEYPGQRRVPMRVKNKDRILEIFLKLIFVYAMSADCLIFTFAIIIIFVLQYLTAELYTINLSVVSNKLQIGRFMGS